MTGSRRSAPVLSKALVTIFIVDHPPLVCGWMLERPSVDQLACSVYKPRGRFTMLLLPSSTASISTLQSSDPPSFFSKLQPQPQPTLNQPAASSF
ncbi:hypothetical protein BZA05DRAFT_46403 [Tricharina praecox]|uniref:uncharacterized protein n=1 Tax=Tricharina praecox TaxID=43433 RepID=UPI00221EAFAB|nr:uncharacterized protein BZA05DRAFT_46403 [Tricharina praecox]KAI5851890.1 hypothetical protein BZA05DRAFT_46403 [Tricharina praecox]